MLDMSDLGASQQQQQLNTDAPSQQHKSQYLRLQKLGGRSNTGSAANASYAGTDENGRPFNYQSAEQINGLTFGTLKEQEFHFKSVLHQTTVTNIPPPHHIAAQEYGQYNQLHPQFGRGADEFQLQQHYDPYSQPHMQLQKPQQQQPFYQHNVATQLQQPQVQPMLATRPQMSRAYYLRSNRGRSYSLPSQQQPPAAVLATQGVVPPPMSNVYPQVAISQEHARGSQFFTPSNESDNAGRYQHQVQQQQQHPFMSQTMAQQQQQQFYNNVALKSLANSHAQLPSQLGSAYGGYEQSQAFVPHNAQKKQLNHHQQQQQPYVPGGVCQTPLSTIAEECSNLNLHQGDACHLLKSKVNFKQALSRLSAGRRDSFISGDPYSERLAVFVSKMVYLIFWQGTGSYSDLYNQYFDNVHGFDLLKNDVWNMKVVPRELQESQATSFNQIDGNFISYTRHLLETMQISCSTAILALFYLHRLRPKVESMFVQGTFQENNCAQSGDSGNDNMCMDNNAGGYVRHSNNSSSTGVNLQMNGCTPVKKVNVAHAPPTPASPGVYQKQSAQQFHQKQQQQQQNQFKAQYRRDPRLEYRLFTIALLLGNKYLDDHSYSNKAWSEVTGIELRKLNVMEMEFLKFVNYEFLVHEVEYVLWVKWLELFLLNMSDNEPFQMTNSGGSSKSINKTANSGHGNSVQPQQVPPSAGSRLTNRIKAVKRRMTIGVSQSNTAPPPLMQNSSNNSHVSSRSGKVEM
ncbi:hypothetical protein MIR68_008588 [Amoeboaphelidium protococcarum]|nr:hypothetical protein MIR68_008588 [Amoeboaphelidium protococcarum]